MTNPEKFPVLEPDPIPEEPAPAPAPAPRKSLADRIGASFKGRHFLFFNVGDILSGTKVAVFMIRFFSNFCGGVFYVCSILVCGIDS